MPAVECEKKRSRDSWSGDVSGSAQVILHSYSRSSARRTLSDWASKALVVPDSTSGPNHGHVTSMCYTATQSCSFWECRFRGVERVNGSHAERHGAAKSLRQVARACDSPAMCHRLPP